MAKVNIKRQVKALRKRLGDKKAQQRIKQEVQKRLKQAKEKLAWLEKQVKSKENQEKVRKEIAKARVKVNQAKKKFKVHQRKAVQYTQKNPEKALAVAAAAGLLAGTILAVLRRKR